MTTSRPFLGCVRHTAETSLEHHLGGAAGFDSAPGFFAVPCGLDAAGCCAGATGAACPRLTPMPNSLHWPSTGAKISSKFTWDGMDGKKPAKRIMPFASISGSTVSCGSITATPERSSLSLRCFAKISDRRAAVFADWKPGAPRSRAGLTRSNQAVASRPWRRLGPGVASSPLGKRASGVRCL